MGRLCDAPLVQPQKQPRRLRLMPYEQWSLGRLRVGMRDWPWRRS